MTQVKHIVGALTSGLTLYVLLTNLIIWNEPRNSIKVFSALDSSALYLPPLNLPTNPVKDSLSPYTYSFEKPGHKLGKKPNIPKIWNSSQQEVLWRSFSLQASTSFPILQHTHTHTLFIQHLRRITNSYCLHTSSRNLGDFIVASLLIGAVKFNVTLHVRLWDYFYCYF